MVMARRCMSCGEFTCEQPCKKCSEYMGKNIGIALLQDYENLKKEIELLKDDFNKLQLRYSEAKSNKIRQKAQLYECIEALKAIKSDYFICGEYFREGFKFHGLTEEEIAVQALNAIEGM